MKTIITISLLLIASVAFAGNTSYVFSITSSAKTSTPNLIVMKMNAPSGYSMARIPGEFTIDAIENYYLTKSTTVTVTGAQAIKIQTAQDTDAKKGSDATNLFRVYSKVDYIDWLK